MGGHVLLLSPLGSLLIYVTVAIWGNIVIQIMRAALVAQLVKNPPAVQETQVPFLGQEDPLEKGKATHSSILAWRIHGLFHGVAKSRTQLSDSHSLTHSPYESSFMSAMIITATGISHTTETRVQFQGLILSPPH